MLREIIKILNELDLNDKTKYSMNNEELKDYILNIFLKAQLNYKKSEMSKLERQELIDANVRIMNKYKAAVKDLKYLLYYINYNKGTKDEVKEITEKFYKIKERGKNYG